MTNPTFKQTMVALPGIGVSMLPKLMCPACWPAYAGIVSALGLGFLISAKYLLPLTVGFLAITATALGYRASRRQGYGPFGLGLIAAAVILAGKFYFDTARATYAGVGLLIVSSVWNSWPRRAATAPFCPACIPAEAGFTQRNLQGEEIHETQN
jgi:mercuric ion transport protein